MPIARMQIDVERSEICAESGADSTVLHEELSSYGKRTQWTERYVFIEYEENFGDEVVICVERTPATIKGEQCPTKS